MSFTNYYLAEAARKRARRDIETNVERADRLRSNIQQLYVTFTCYICINYVF